MLMLATCWTHMSLSCRHTARITGGMPAESVVAGMNAALQCPMTAMYLGNAGQTASHLGADLPAPGHDKLPG